MGVGCDEGWVLSSSCRVGVLMLLLGMHVLNTYGYCWHVVHRLLMLLLLCATALHPPAPLLLPCKQMSVSPFGTGLRQDAIQCNDRQ